MLASVYVPMIFCDTPDLGAFDRLSLHWLDGGLQLSCANDIISPRSPLSLRVPTAVALRAGRRGRQFTPDLFNCTALTQAPTSHDGLV